MEKLEIFEESTISFYDFKGMQLKNQFYNSATVFFLSQMSFNKVMNKFMGWKYKKEVGWVKFSR